MPIKPMVFETSYGPMTYKDMADFTGRNVVTMRCRMKLVKEGKIDIDTVLDNQFFEDRIKHGQIKGSKVKNRQKRRPTKLELQRMAERKGLEAIPAPSPVERRMEEMGIL